MKILYLLAVIAAFSTNVFAQKDDSKSKFVRLLVFDDYGRYISGLKPENITLRENKETKEISRLLFEENEPVAVLVLIDGGYFPAIAAKTALQFIQKANSANDYCIIRYNQNTELLADWKSNDDEIVASLKNIADSKSKAKDFVPFDAISLGLEKLQQSPLRKKVLMILGSSYDTKSKVSFENLKDSIKNSDTIIYAVKVTMQSDYSSILIRDEKFEKLAELSGGKLFDLYLDSGRMALAPRSEIGNGFPARTEVIQKPSSMIRNPEKNISELCDVLVTNIEKTYLVAYPRNSLTDKAKIEIKINLQDDKGKKIKTETRVKKLLQD